jgi:nicotinic acid mononucleotide adenylyltransferase
LRSRVRADAASGGTVGPTAIFRVDADTRDVSSTTIRARLAARKPVDDLVPASVARHISRHNLYLENNLHGHDQNVQGT